MGVMASGRGTYYGKITVPCQAGCISRENPETETTVLHNMHFDYKGRLMVGEETLKSKIMKKIIEIRNLLTA